MKGIAPTDNDGACGLARQESRLGVDQACDEQRQGEYINETKQPQFRLAQEGPQRLRTDKDRKRIVKAVQRPVESDQECGQCEACREAKRPASPKPRNPA